MAGRTKREVARALVKGHGRLVSEDLGIDLTRGTPTPLFRWLCASLLFSARISESIAMEATRNLARRGWTTANKLAGSTWEARVKALNKAGYARYQERTATMLGEAAELVRDRWGGDLRGLREEAGHDPKRERALIKEVKGIGAVGADIFFREVQAVWDELFPFADRRARQGASRLGLGREVEALARLVSRRDFPRLVAALVRVRLGDVEAQEVEALRR